jgi:phage shock protein A
MSYAQRELHRKSQQIVASSERILRVAELALSLGNVDLIDHINGRLTDLEWEIAVYKRTGTLPTDIEQEDEYART